MGADIELRRHRAAADAAAGRVHHVGLVVTRHIEHPALAISFTKLTQTVTLIN